MAEKIPTVMTSLPLIPRLLTGSDIMFSPFWLDYANFVREKQDAGRPSHMMYFTEDFPACLFRLDDFIPFGWSY